MTRAERDRLRLTQQIEQAEAAAGNNRFGQHEQRLNALRVRLAEHTGQWVGFFRVTRRAQTTDGLGYGKVLSATAKGAVVDFGNSGGNKFAIWFLPLQWLYVIDGEPPESTDTPWLQWPQPKRVAGVMA